MVHAITTWAGFFFSLWIGLLSNSQIALFLRILTDKRFVSHAFGRKVFAMTIVFGDNTKRTLWQTKVHLHTFFVILLNRSQRRYKQAFLLLFSFHFVLFVCACLFGGNSIHLSQPFFLCYMCISKSHFKTCLALNDCKRSMRITPCKSWQCSLRSHAGNLRPFQNVWRNWVNWLLIILSIKLYNRPDDDNHFEKGWENGEGVLALIYFTWSCIQRNSRPL